MKEESSGSEVGTSAADKIIIQSLARVDSVALGIACGVLAGVVLFAATLFLVLKGGEEIGPRLSLLNQYFPGYEVTVIGSIIGLFYGFVTGFVLGWLSASIRNLIFRIYINVYKVKRNLSGINEFIDNP